MKYVCLSKGEKKLFVLNANIFTLSANKFLIHLNKKKRVREKR